MHRFKVQPDKDAKYHLEVSVEGNQASIDFYSIKREEGKEEIKLTPIGNIKGEFKSHKELVETIKHFYWELGKYKDQIDGQEAAIDIELKQEGEKIVGNAVEQNN